MSSINRINHNIIIIKKDKFNIKNVECEITPKKINRSFLNINYLLNKETNINKLRLDGLFLETNKIKLFSPIKLIPNLKNKYIIELPLVNNSKLLTIFSDIDNKFNKLINNIKTKISNKQETTNILENDLKMINYLDIIKKKTILFNDNKYNYNYVKLKLNINECLIYYNNEPFYNKLETLNYNNISINCIIQSFGVWKYENTYGLTWKIIKMYIQDTNINNLNNSILNNEININDDEYILKKKKTKKKNIIKIPNFELDLEDI